MKGKLLAILLVVSVALGVASGPAAYAYTAGASYTWDASVPNYDASAVIHSGTIDTTSLVMGDFLGVSAGNPNAPGYGDSGVSVGWDDTWVSGVGHPNTNGDNLDGLWAQIIYPAEGWWDLGAATDKVAVFLSQDHGPYLAEGLEYRIYGSNTLWGAVGAQAVITDVYLDGWRTHNPAEDGNGNGWCSDDIAAVLQLDGAYRYVKLAAWSSGGGLYEPEVDAVAAVRTINKTLSASEGELGDVVHVTLSVTVLAGETATVVDTLGWGFHYVHGSFTVNGISATPTVDHGEISYTVTEPGAYVIEFEVKVDEAYWEDRETCNVVVATWYNAAGEVVDEREAVACFIINAFEELHKNVGIPKADVVFAIDLTGSMSGEIAEVKAEATNIMNSLAAQIADVQFGLISYMDYDGTYSTTEPGSVPETYTALYGDAAYGDYPYNLDQDITSNTATVATAIAGLTIGWGADGPEDYTRIVHESWNDPNLHWRTDAKRILILFGDNVPHDTNFDNDNDGTLENTGGDPGRDNAIGTVDDLDFETEVANAAANGVHIMAVYSGSSVQKYPWTYMAAETGGEYFELEEAEDIPDAIKDLIKAQAQESLTIKEGTETQWAVVIDIVNPFGFTMEDVVITDRFGAEIEIDEPFPFSITHGTVSYSTKGKSAKVFLTWEIGDVLPGETARLILLVSTDLNPAGHQEYSTPGIYELNSGATLKFIDPEQDMQLSAHTDSIYVIVLPAEDP